MGAVAIVLLNQKGGVGKTSTCHHLAGTLARMGRRVLLMDNDPQGSLPRASLARTPPVISTRSRRSMPCTTVGPTRRKSRGRLTSSGST